MPITFQLSQPINRPISEVFAFLSDFSNMASWNYYIQTVTKISEGEIGVGTLFEMKRPHDLNTFKITELNSPHRIAVELQPPGLMQQLVFECNENGVQPEVTYQWYINLEKYKLLAYIPGGFFKRLILSIPKYFILKKTKPAVEQNFKKLKELLETGRVTLQDGRHVVLP